MSKIKFVHDTAKNGNFPKDKLEEIEGINVSVSVVESDVTKQSVEINVDKSYGNDMPSLAFYLGVLAQNYINLNKIK